MIPVRDRTSLPTEATSYPKGQINFLPDSQTTLTTQNQINRARAVDTNLETCHTEQHSHRTETRNHKNEVNTVLFHLNIIEPSNSLVLAS